MPDSRARTNFYIFPTDRKIENLGVLNRKFDCRIVAYAPEKCATAECFEKNGEVFGYAKIYAEKEWQTGKKVCQFLTEQTRKNFPKLLAFDEENRILLMEAVKGNRLSELDKTQITNGFRLLGKAIGEFHNLSTAINLPKFSRLSPDKINFALKIISVARPDCAVQAKNLAENLLKSFLFADEEKVVLHGDVHPKNGILQEAETVTLIDFDQLSKGSSAAEIGSFLAGLLYKEIIGFDSKDERCKFSAAFLDGYAKIRPLPSQESLNWHTATALLTERAFRSISRIRVEGLQNFSQILAVSEQVLAGGVI